MTGSGCGSSTGTTPGSTARCSIWPIWRPTTPSLPSSSRSSSAVILVRTSNLGSPEVSPPCNAPRSCASRCGARSPGSPPPSISTTRAMRASICSASSGTGSGSRSNVAEFPAQARAVVIGGGIVGCSTAYHLAKLGWTDTIIIERHKLTSGSTHHAAGLVGQLRTSANITQLLGYSVALYDALEAETGLASGWQMNGGLRLACTEARWIELKRQATSAPRSEEHTSELQSHSDLVCRLLLEKKKIPKMSTLVRGVEIQSGTGVMVEGATVWLVAR